MRIDELREQMSDQSRHFVDMPEVVFFDDLADHLQKLPGYILKEYEVDGVIRGWMEFGFANNTFFVDNDRGDFRFYVEDPKCPDDILLELTSHLRALVEKNAPINPEL